jgi:hypothetical protein
MWDRANTEIETYADVQMNGLAIEKSIIRTTLTGQASSSQQGQSHGHRPKAHVSRGVKTSIANRLLVEYCVRIEIQFFCAQSLAPETNSSYLYDSMNRMRRLQ